jgi:hypothetical protein
MINYTVYINFFMKGFNNTSDICHSTSSTARKLHYNYSIKSEIVPWSSSTSSDPFKFKMVTQLFWKWAVFIKTSFARMQRCMHKANVYLHISTRSGQRRCGLWRGRRIHEETKKKM